MTVGDLFPSGRVVDLILLVLLAEFAFLTWRRARSGSGVSATNLFFALAPGACLLAALRVALTQSGWVWVAVWLAMSFPIHVADLARRSS